MDLRRSTAAPALLSAAVEAAPVVTRPATTNAGRHHLTAIWFGHSCSFRLRLRFRLIITGSSPIRARWSLLRRRHSFFGGVRKQGLVVDVVNIDRYTNVIGGVHMALSGGLCQGGRRISWVAGGLHISANASVVVHSESMCTGQAGGDRLRLCVVLGADMRMVPIVSVRALLDWLQVMAPSTDGHTLIVLHFVAGGAYELGICGMNGEHFAVNCRWH